jgi:cytochrome P450
MNLRYDPLDPEFLENPYPTYAQLRDDDPVHYHRATDEVPGFWALSRFTDIWDAVRSTKGLLVGSGPDVLPRRDRASLGSRPTW